LRLARDFAAVVLIARNEKELEQTAADVKSAGAESLTYALDLREPRSAETVVKGALERFGRIDALLNIAGAVPQIDLFEMTDAQWEDGIALKLHGARRLTIRAWEALKASNGSVVLMSGSAALDPKPGFAAVAATNAAIIALAKAFAEQGIKDGVQVNSVVPGAVMTGRRRSFFEKWGPAHNLTVEEAMKKFPEEVGISRFGKPEEIADLMAFLVSPAAKWMTGTSVRMDGGEIKGI
jgi:3-oxoacyl-[acyl-carrier protein] reductase